MMSFLQHKTNDMRWAVWKVEESLDALLLLLPGARRTFCEQELNHFVSEHHEVERLSVRALLYSMLWEDKGVGYSLKGKPYLADHSLSISASYTKGYMAVVLASPVPIDIDIKQYVQRVHKVCDRYIHPDEQVESYQGDITWGLLLHWPTKGVVFKRMEDAGAGLRKLRLMHFIPQEEGTFQVQGLTVAQQGLYSIGYRVCQDFVLMWTLSWTDEKMCEAPFSVCYCYPSIVSFRNEKWGYFIFPF